MSTNTKKMVFTRWQPIIEWKRNWQDSWAMVPWLLCKSLTLALHPTMQQATFDWQYGRQSLAGGPMTNYPRWDTILGTYVRVVSPKPTGQDENGNNTYSTMFIGRITNDADDKGGHEPAATGSQTITAYGLQRLLKTDGRVTGSYMLRGADVYFIDRPLPFNFCLDDGVGVRGNCSYAKSSKTGCHVFSDASTAIEWDAKKVVEYLLKMFGPAEVPFGLATGNELDNLSTYKDVWEAPETVMDGYEAVIKRQRGLGWTVRYDLGEQPMIAVRSVFEKQQTTAGIVLAANSEQHDCVINTPDLAANLTIRQSHDNMVDRIRVLGNYVWMCASLNFNTTGHLIPAWTTTRKNDAGQTTSIYTMYGAADDTQRAETRYEQLWRAFKVNFAGGSVPFDLGPIAAADGTLNFKRASVNFRMGRRLTRNTPIKLGAEYTGTPPLEVIVDTLNKELSPMRVYAKIDGKYYDLSTVSQVLDKTTNCTISPLANDCGILIHTPYPHYLAANSFTASAKYLPLADWRYCIATVAMRSDYRLQYCVELTNAMERLQLGRPPRELIIELKDAECWLIQQGTVTGVNDGVLQQTSDNIVTRNDSDRLKAVAALAAAWYGRRRVAATLNIPELDDSFMPGHLLTAVKNQVVLEKINAIISQITWDFEHQTTVVETDYAELDFVALSGKGRKAESTGIDFSGIETSRERVARDTHAPAHIAAANPGTANEYPAIQYAIQMLLPDGGGVKPTWTEHRLG